MGETSNDRKEFDALVEKQLQCARDKKKLPEPEKQRLRTLRKQFEAQTHQLLSPESGERGRLDAALEEGVRRGLVDIKDYGDPTWPKHCVLMGSSHYPHVTTHVADVPHETRRGFYELFALLRIFRERNIQSELLAEGGMQGETMGADVKITLPSGEFPLQSDEVQRHFVNNPDHFMMLMDDMHRAGGHPSFYGMTGYKHVSGAHSAEVNAILDDIYDRQLHAQQFREKYKPKDTTENTVQSVLRENRWWILINGHYMKPEEILKDCDDCIRFIDDLDVFNVIREDEMVDHFMQTPTAAPTRMGWVGLAHVQRITEECLKKQISVRTVIPVASRETKATDAQDDRKTATEIRGFVLQYVTLNAQLDAQARQ